MSNWEWKKIGDVAEIKGRIGFRGYTKSDLVKKGEGAITLSPSNIKDNKLIFDNCSYISWAKYDESPEIQVSIGDIVFCKTASIGKVAIVESLPEKTTLNPQFIVLKKITCNNKYLYYYLFCPELKKKIQAITTGTAVPTLSQSNFSAIKLPIPPLAEQKRIVKTLDEKFAKIDKLKTAAETNLKNAKELFYAELKKTFHEKGSWKTVQLGEIALEYGRGKSKHRPRNDECLFGGEYPFIQTGDIRNSGKYVVDYTETYNEIGLAQSKLWPKGTLCITIAANIAETAILTFPCCFPDSVIGFVPNEQYSSVDFIYYVILYFRTELQKISKGAAQDNLNLAKLESMNFPLPPLSVQKEIVARLDKLSENVKRLEANYKQIIANCDELKKTTLKQTFQGGN